MKMMLLERERLLKMTPIEIFLEKEGAIFVLKVCYTVCADQFATRHIRASSMHEYLVKIDSQ